MDARPDFVKSVALVIGIDAYDHGVPPLRTAAADAARLAQILGDDHGYDVRLLTDADASGEAITAALADLGKTLGPDDRALFYFAGHGVALDGDDGPTGYLLPQDAVRGEAGTYLHMPAVNDALAAVPARHMLVVLDSCFSGAFRWSSTRDLVLVPEVVHQERYDRFILDPAWQALASASHDQTALDEIPGAFGDRGDEGGHSPFARALFDALGGAADLVPAGEGNGVITASELYLYLEQAVQPATMDAGHRQTPRLWPLAKHDKGEFIFLVPGHELNLPPAPPLTYENNPWRGLESYDEADADLFFGRDEVIDGLHAHVAGHALSAVLGASGTGKSSVVKAGLVPRLKGEGWRVLPVVRPGSDPLHALEVAVAHLGAEPEAVVATDSLSADVATTSPLPVGEGQGEGTSGASEVPTRTEAVTLPTHGGDGASVAVRPDHAALADAIEARVGAWLAKNPDGRLALVVDQLEELVTLTRTPAERDAALALLRRLADAHPHRLRIVLTLRSDFEPQFDRSALEGLWAAGRFVVPPFSQAELREVVEKPASERVMYFDPHGLVDELVEEVIQTPGGLPLLSFALSEMYVHYIDRQSDDRAIERADYQGVGGVVGALRTRADAEYDALDAASRETMRRVMLRMVAAEGGGIARRRVPRAELAYPDPAETARVDEVVRRLTAARLVVEGRDDDGERYVEPAHDALVRAWDRLLGWIHAEQDRVADLRFQHNMARAAGEWDQTEDKARNGLLWRDAARGSVLDTLVATEDDTHAADLPAVARLRRGARALRHRVSGPPDREPTWMNRRELAFARRSIQRRTRIRLGLATLVALIALGGVTAFIQSQIAQRERYVALTRLYLGEADEALDRDPVEALVFAMGAADAAMRANAPDSVLAPVRMTLFQVLQAPRVVYQVNTGGEGVWDIDQRGERFAAVEKSGRVRVWDVETSDEVDAFGGADDPLTWAALSPDGRRLVAGDGDGGARIWDLDGGREPIALELASDTEPAWAPEGDRLLIVSGSERGARVVDAATGEVRRTVRPGRRITQVWSAADGRLVTRTAGADGGRPVQIWADGDDEAVAELPIASGPAAVSPDGATFAAVDLGEGGPVVRLWDTATGDLQGMAEAPETVDSAVGAAIGLRFTPDGAWLVVGNDANEFVAFDLRDGISPVSYVAWRDPSPQLGTGEPRPGFPHLAFVGERVVLAGADGRARIHALNPVASGEQALNTSQRIVAAEGLADGRVLTASEDGTIRLWDLDAPPATRQFQTVRGFPYLSADGRRVTLMGTGRRWSVETGEELAAGEAGATEVEVRGGRVLAPDTGDSAAPDELFAAEGMAIKQARAFADGRRLALVDAEGQVWVVPIGGSLPPAPLGSVEEAGSYQVIVSPDERWVLVQVSTSAPGVDPSGVLFDVESGATRSLPVAGWPVFSADGGTLVAKTRDHPNAPLRVYETATGEPVGEIESMEVSSFRVSPDGERLLTVHSDNVLRVWDWENAPPPLVYRTHARADADPMNELRATVSPDGAFVISSASGDARIWNVATGEDVAVIEGGVDPVVSAALDADGGLVVARSSGAVRVYDLDLETMRQRAEDRLPSYADPEYQARLLGL